MWPERNPEDQFRYSPDEPAAAAPAATPETAQVDPTPSADAPAGGTSGVQSATTTSAAAPTDASAGTTVTQPATQAASWLDSFRAEGFQATDETQARQALLQSYRDAERLRPLAPALSAYQQHAQQFHQWLNDQQRQQPPAQQDWTEAAGWNPPAGNYEQLRRQVTTDAQGNVVAVPGAPPDAVVKFQAAQAYRQEFTEKFLSNPGKALEPFIKQIAQQVASQYTGQEVGQYREQQEAQQFIQKHSNWLFDQENGAPKTEQILNTQTGRYESQQVLSQYGKLFVQNLQTAAQRGLPSDLQQQYAMQAVQNAYMASPDYAQYIIAQNQQRQQPAPATNGTARQQANAGFTQRANPAAPPTAKGGGNATPAPQKVTRENLEQVMLRRFQEAGVTGI